MWIDRPLPSAIAPEPLPAMPAELSLARLRFPLLTPSPSSCRPCPTPAPGPPPQGKRAQRLDYARTTFASTADLLMRRAEAAAAAAGRTPAMAHTDWRWWLPGSPLVARNPYAGVEPENRSVLSMLMQATNKETGAGLADSQIAAQCPTLITAGYETSSNALAFAVYLLASHPAAEAALLAEVDAFGRERVRGPLGMRGECGGRE